MIVSKAYARYIRVSPRKARQVIDLIRGEKINRALAILANIKKRAKVYVEKALGSAIKNAQQNPQVLTEELFISKITADKGPMLKRFRAAAMGRATMIRRRTTHLTIELTESTVKQVKESNRKPATKGSPKERSLPERGRSRGKTSDRRESRAEARENQMKKRKKVTR